MPNTAVSTEAKTLGRGGEDSGETQRLAYFGDALADPLRVRVLGLLAEAKKEGRGCCGLPATDAPQTSEQASEVCVCELEAYFGFAQSKISYHLRKLVRAGLVSENKRGRWNFYSINEQAVATTLDGIAQYLHVVNHRR